MSEMAVTSWDLEITRVPSIRDPIARPPRGERLLASGDFHPPQFVASNCVLFEGSLIEGVRRTLGGERTRSRTASYTFGEDESGNLGVVIVVRHDLPLPEGKLRTGCSFVLGLNTVLDLAIVYKITSYFTEIFN